MRFFDQRVLAVLLVVLASLILLGLYHDRPDPASWARYEYFRCRTCNGPASIDPDQPERWGCRACGFTTFRLIDRFHTATLADLPTQAALNDAMQDAGVIVPADAGRTLMDLYQASR